MALLEMKGLNVIDNHPPAAAQKSIVRQMSNFAIHPGDTRYWYVMEGQTQDKPRTVLDSKNILIASHKVENKGLLTFRNCAAMFW